MINKIKDYINKNNLIKPNSKIVIALSGGVDSMVLYNVMKKLNYDIIIAHVNHNVRLESAVEEEYIKNMCANDNIPIEILHLEKIHENFEATAHNRRYAFFLNVCKKYNASYLVTAHHADDNLETIILNLMSGSNLYGYGGIAQKLVLDNINIIRPLLLVSKKEIKEYALKNNIKYFEDYTNQLDDYTRNRIRHHIIPKLKDECPNILDRSNAYSKQVHEAFDFARGFSIDFLKDNIININDFKNLHPYIKKDVICLLLENYEIERGENLINDLINIIENDKAQLDYDLKKNYILKKRYNTAYIEKKENKNAFHFEINGFDDIINYKQYKIYLSKEKPTNAIYIKLCYNDIAFPLIIRNRYDGDKISLTAGHKKIKDLFIDKKVLKDIRDEIPIIVDGNNNILWVLDYAKSKDLFKYKDNFDCYLVVEVIKC